MTKKLLFIFLGAVFLTLPVFAKAADYRASDNITIGKDEIINDDLIVPWGKVTVDGTINGNLVMLGSELVINGTVNGSVISMFGNTEIKGSVRDGFYSGVGELALSDQGTIGGNAVMGAGELAVQKGTVIGKDIVMGPGQIVIAGTTGAIKNAIGTLTLGDGAVVNGNIDYYSDQDVKRESGAIVTGEINRKGDFSSIGHNVNWSRAQNVLSFFSIIILLLFALIAFWLFPKKSQVFAEEFKTKPMDNLLWGLLTAILAPVAVILLFISVIGIPFGLALILILIIYGALAKIFGMVAVGSWIMSAIERKDKIKASAVGVLMGALVFYVLNFIPVIGQVISSVLVLMSFGLFVIMTKKVLRESR